MEATFPPIDLARLREPFPVPDIEWKPGAVTRDKTRGLAMAYITSRAIQDRLDDVCGPANWRNEFKSGPEGGVLCGISINVTGDPFNPNWVTKWDGAENTEVEAIKGGLSSAMKRAAVQWGVGRYLYDMPAQWVPLNDKGRFAEVPRIPAKYAPQDPAPSPAQRPSGPRRTTGGRSNGNARSGERVPPQSPFPTGEVMR